MRLILQVLSAIGRHQPVRLTLTNLAMNFGGCQLTWSKEFVVISSSMRPTELKGKAPSQNKTVRLKLQEIYDFLVDFTAIGAYAYPKRTHKVNLRDHLNTIRSRYKKRKPAKKAREEATKSN